MMKLNSYAGPKQLAIGIAPMITGHGLEVTN
jgi:hypothetical protein